jgi:FkbM family methyltransferase
MNRISNYSRKPFWMRMPPAQGGWRFCCDLRDSIAREVCFTGQYEPQETALVQAILKPGMTFVDVGANWGYFTMLAAHHVEKKGRVICLEPDPRLFTVLKENISVNHLDQVTALPIAAGSRSGWLTLAGYDESGGNFGLSRVVNQSSGSDQTFQVAAQTLDEVFRQESLEVVDLVKMDIEGAESQALLGMQQSLANQRVHRLLLELHPAQLAGQGQSAADLIERIRDFGYRIWKIDHSERTNRWASYRRNLDFKQVVMPFEMALALDHWPHLICVARDFELIS